MARKLKVGLDYFELDCHMNEKIELIEAEYGLKGFAIIVKLYQNIYGGFGYYCEWTPDLSLLWARRLGVSQGGAIKNLDKAKQSASLSGFGKNFDKVEKSASLSGFPNNLINNVVSAAIRRDIFSAKLFQKYQILTSIGIQERYLNAVSRREKIELKKEYLLIPVDKNQKNVVINEENVNRNKENADRNKQSRGEKSRGEKKDTMCKVETLALIEKLFEELWKLYPVKKGKGQVSFSAKQRLFQVGYEEMVRAINRYKIELEKDKDWRKPQNGSTFFNSGYIDYLDANYVAEEKGQKKEKKNTFQNFPQRNYDYEALERQLLLR